MIRKAKIQDVKAIYRLLDDYGRIGSMISRPLSELYDHVRDFWVYSDGMDPSNVLGCCALQFCWEELAEIRSLAVRANAHQRTIGTQLLNEALNEARIFGIAKVFTLTYQPGFFEKFGFKIIDRADLPLKIWADCIICVKYPDCDEIAMLKEIV